MSLTSALTEQVEGRGLDCQPTGASSRLAAKYALSRSEQEQIVGGGFTSFTSFTQEGGCGVGCSSFNSFIYTQDQVAPDW